MSSLLILSKMASSLGSLKSVVSTGGKKAYKTTITFSIFTLKLGQKLFNCTISSLITCTSGVNICIYVDAMAQWIRS